MALDRPNSAYGEAIRTLRTALLLSRVDNPPKTVLVTSSIPGEGKTSIALTWDQIREMSDAGADIQSHSLTHPYLTKRRHGSMSDAQYASWLRAELSESKRILEKESGKKVQFLAYPYGDYDASVAEASARAGYTAALTCDFAVPGRRFHLGCGAV